MNRSSDKNYYQVLGVDPDAEMAEIRDAYHQLALKYHPDKNPGKSSERQFNQVQQAYETLSSYKRRREYDTHLSMHGSILPIGLSPGIFERVFSGDLFDSDLEIPGGIQGAAIYSSAQSYHRGPDGRVKRSRKVTTNLGGKQQQYQHRQELDQQGHVVRQQGHRIPDDKIQREISKYWQRQAQPKRLKSPKRQAIEYAPQHQHQAHHRPKAKQATIDPFKYRQQRDPSPFKFLWDWNKK